MSPLVILLTIIGASVGLIAWIRWGIPWLVRSQDDAARKLGEARRQATEYRRRETQRGRTNRTTAPLNRRAGK